MRIWDLMVTRSSSQISLKISTYLLPYPRYVYSAPYVSPHSTIKVYLCAHTPYDGVSYSVNHNLPKCMNFSLYNSLEEITEVDDTVRPFPPCTHFVKDNIGQ